MDSAGTQSEVTQQSDLVPIEEIADDPDAVVERFVDLYLIEDAESSVTSRAVYERYDHWAEQNDLDPDSKSWFARRLSNHITFERTTRRDNGDPVRYYEGLALDSHRSVDE
ncbi:primase-like DNA-binding domain-containing protein [Halobellus sp. H-GB7]|uniref:primase-like DNA-binding domain-containing protein n=1 Tax=Halobellus sp. H-GB7 TaxID=3069756 RepID=UPI0027AEDD1A|nr:primase-like DNA-binding domain-containing protein [Halobellus sp. H-GB7]MDQ2055955.1 primase-like DNA-binding domain-containing protein [Halobellus sp. H-GB7]